MESVVGLQTVMYAIPVIYAVVVAMLVVSMKFKIVEQTQTA